MTTHEFIMISAASLLLALALGLGIGFLIVMYGQNKTQDASGQDLIRQSGWYLELWDVSLGIRFSVSFYGSITLGRSSQGKNRPGFISVGKDIFISRQQCVIGEQNGTLVIWNLSRVNPTMVNGVLLEKPEILCEGDRILLGSRTFLLTRLAAITG